MSSYDWISLSWFHQLSRVFFRMFQFLQTVVSIDRKMVSSVLQYLQVLIKVHKVVVWYSIRIGFLDDLSHNNGMICSHATLSTQHYRSFKYVALWIHSLLSHIFIPTALKLSTRKSSKVRDSDIYKDQSYHGRFLHQALYETVCQHPSAFVMALSKNNQLPKRRKMTLTPSSIEFLTCTRSVTTCFYNRDLSK